ncbi:hypothetical protein Tco_0286173 [Tanacetum coccineum]
MPSRPIRANTKPSDHGVNRRAIQVMNFHMRVQIWFLGWISRGLGLNRILVGRRMKRDIPSADWAEWTVVGSDWWVGRVMRSHETIRKRSFIKGDMAKNGYLVCIQVETAIPMVTSRITKRYRKSCTRLEFVVGLKVRIT